MEAEKIIVSLSFFSWMGCGMCVGACVYMERVGSFGQRGFCFVLSDFFVFLGVLSFVCWVMQNFLRGFGEI